MAADTQTIAGVARALRAREATSEAIVDRCLQRIAERNAALNAFITVFETDARGQAREADRDIEAGRYRGPLHGVPISLKDLIDVRGSVTTAASLVRRNHVAAADAAVTTRLRAAGAILIGKTNLHEFALGTTNEDSAYGPARHPLDLNRSPGGSSGGSAAAVADGMCFGSIGTDTGGSIRIPAAICGLVGLKPGVGEVPTEGVVPLSVTLDHVGPIARSVEDAGLIHTVLRGGDAAGASALTNGAVRLGIARDYFFELLDTQVRSCFDAGCERLRSAGAVIDDVVVPHAGDVPAIYSHIVLAEGAAYHANTLERRPNDYTPNVRARLEMGRYILAEDFARALRGRDLVRREVDAALRGIDALVLPAVPIAAPKIGMPMVRIGANEEPARNVMLRCTQAFNISGHPAISIPCGVNADGLPIGLQLVGRFGMTSKLLETAAFVERHLGPGISR
jgi:aspartyl-tRNA(Asn)/glutamyl-tRNA(Gln) amidotransferase subunit A